MHYDINDLVLCHNLFNFHINVNISEFRYNYLKTLDARIMVQYNGPSWS